MLPPGGDGLLVWDTAKGTTLHSIEADEAPRWIQVAADGKSVLTASGNRHFNAYELSSGKHLYSFPGTPCRRCGSLACGFSAIRVLILLGCMLVHVSAAFTLINLGSAPVLQIGACGCRRAWLPPQGLRSLCRPVGGGGGAVRLLRGGPECAGTPAAAHSAGKAQGCGSWWDRELWPAPSALAPVWCCWQVHVHKLVLMWGMTLNKSWHRGTAWAVAPPPSQQAPGSSMFGH